MHKKKETAALRQDGTIATPSMVRMPISTSYETTELSGINPAAECARQLRIIELLERIAAAVSQSKAPENHKTP